MKTLLLHFSILFSIIQIQAQVVFNRAYHDLNEVANPFLLAIHGDIYYTSSRYAPHSVSSTLYKHSSLGTLKQLGSIGGNTVKQMITSNDNKLLISGILNYCDLPPIIEENYILKLDTNGSTIFSVTYTVNSGDYPKVCLQFIDSSYFTFTDSLLFKHSSTGQLISKTNLGLKSISAAILLPNNNILVSAKLANTVNLVEISPIGNTVQITPFPTLINKLSLYGGQKIIAKGTDGILYKLSPSRNLIGASSNSTSTTISDFICSSDTIYCIFSNSVNLSNYAVIDTSFNSVFNSSTNTHSLIQCAINLNSSKVIILSNGLASQNSWGSNSAHYYCSISSLNKYGDNNFQSDLKLCDVQADSTYVQYNIPFLRPLIKVKNTGNTIITSFKLNFFISPSIDCGLNIYQEFFSNLSINTGDSLMLVASKFALKPYSNLGSLNSFTTDYCFYVSVPNNETDKTVEDNKACKTFNFLVTSLKENSKLEQFISIAPNPFKAELMIEADSKISQISIYNTLGQVIKTQEASDKKVDLNNSDLQNGIYFLHIETEKGTVIKKVLKN